ncbi:MAG: hypothetical protein Q8P67_27115 [archaeon]|nr:hypothetical protein [archaeon]
MLYCGVECEAIDRATHRRVCWAAGEEAPPVVCSSGEAMRWTAAMLQECGVKRLCRADIVDMGPAKLASAIASGVVTVRMATSLALALAPLNIQLRADEKEKAKSEEQQAEVLEGDGKKQLAWISDLIHRVLSRGDKECVAIRQDDCHQYAAEAVFCNLRMEDRRQRTAGVPRLYCLAHPKRKRGWKGSFETLVVVLVPQSQGQPILIDVGLASEKGYRFRDVNKAICSVAMGYALLRSLESVGGLMVGL